MWILEQYYKWRKKEVPYYAKYSLGKMVWKPTRKFLNVVVIPNIPFTGMRIAMYRMIGFKIGKNCFIGMKCYFDDMEPERTIIGNRVSVSYGCYFSMHGRRQEGHNTITIEDGVYLGMRVNVIASMDDVVIGRKAIVGAGSLVNKSIPPNHVAVGIPAKVISDNAQPDLILD